MAADRPRPKKSMITFVEMAIASLDCHPSPSPLDEDMWDVDPSPGRLDLDDGVDAEMLRPPPPQRFSWPLSSPD